MKQMLFEALGFQHESRFAKTARSSIDIVAIRRDVDRSLDSIVFWELIVVDEMDFALAWSLRRVIMDEVVRWVESNIA